MHARHRCDVDIFQNTGHFTYRSRNVGYKCRQVHFRIDERVFNRCCERSMFRPVLMHPSERLVIRLPPRWISFPIQLKSNTSISVGLAIDEVDIRQLGVHLMIHVPHPPSMSEMRKPHAPILPAHKQYRLCFPM
ncbi:hypothetical protein TNCV_605931 [Trichonephila clavipes]|nr:hypothetical protein TNCV_605931 [Trichonephila clavipes]